MTKYMILAASLAALISCTDAPQVTRAAATNTYQPGQNAPADAAPGTCWDKTQSPAIVQTVTEDVLITPAQISETGTVQALPVYRSETRQVILQERQPTWFQTLCSADLTPEFVSSLQRALAARGYYAGPVTGFVDAPTSQAIQAYQQSAGIAAPDPGVLMVEGARKLGLWTVERQAS